MGQKGKTNRKNKALKLILMTDWVMLVLFIFIAYSGIGLHIVWHRNNHDLWHNWAVFHVIVSILFLVTSMVHIITHRNWYKGVLSKGIMKKSKITILLSIVFFIVSITGFMLLGIDGANSKIGLWHYKIGIATIILAFGHILKHTHFLFI